ncbi:FAD:protein FMN transferase [Collinsella sp. zg1085]|uniref:FAD:protein FMN transferase n=1 Tax=Collinsella sp. zg1085 TaxID=2844380 RepID=UPI001C0D3C2F|nr:FAD:protein FMN transferase [Collinsella sp. zg1085]QWT17775.1 FAD:protein FMN transferase [Collinsella sp. zg1085]
MFTTLEFFACDTMCFLTAEGECAAEALHAAETLCHWYEHLLSEFIDGTDISRINNTGGYPVEVHPEVAHLLELSLSYCEASGGRFDITAEPLARLWNYHTAQLPSPSMVEEAKQHVNYRGVHVRDNRVWLDDAQACITLGGTAKGYIADKMRELLICRGQERGMVNLGGNIAIFGERSDGFPWEVVLDNPAQAGSPVAILDVGPLAVVTSGVSERFFKIDGERYHHIVDVSTGYPAKTDILSVTVIDSSAMRAEGFSTTLLLAGSKEAYRMAIREGLELLIVRDDGLIITSPGLISGEPRTAAAIFGVVLPVWQLF